jgi:hypothetical protein
MPKKGYKQSPEHLEKNRLARMNCHPSDETREKMRLAHSGEKNHNFGKKFSEETRAKLSAAMTGENNPGFGKHRPDYVKKAIGDAHRGEKNKFFGKPLPDGVKEKIRISTSGEKNHNYGKKFSDETKEKLAAYRIGTHHSEETKQKIHDAQVGEKAKNFGKKFSEETKDKISEKMSGENHPQWRGGTSSEPYCPKWTNPNLKIRKRVRAFFGNVCILCGADKDQNHDKNMSVHHVMGNKSACCEGDNKDWLFATLCAKCHNTKGLQPETEGILRDIINSKYGGKCMHAIEDYNKLFPNGSISDMQWGSRKAY